MSNEININEIKSNAALLDSEQLHLYIINQVNEGKSDTYIDALVEYVETHDIDEYDIKKYISQTLYAILYKECAERKLMKDCETSSVFDELGI